MRSSALGRSDPSVGINQPSTLDDTLNTTANDVAEEEEKERFLGLKPTAVIGGALASCTAAVLGGHLGVAGTVAGAALTSFTIAVGGAVYTRTFDKTKDGIGSAVSKLRVTGTPPVTTPQTQTVALQGASPQGPPTLAIPTQATPAQVYSVLDNDATRVVPVQDRLRAAQGYVQPAADPTRVVAAQAQAIAKSEEVLPWYRRVLSIKVLGLAAALFLITAVVVTGWEFVRGQSVSGGEGTTISKISRGEVTRQDSNPASGQDQNQGPAITEPTPAPTSTVTIAPSTEPTSEATTEPIAESTSEATTEPTTAPTSDASQDPSSSQNSAETRTDDTGIDSGADTGGTDTGDASTNSGTSGSDSESTESGPHTGETSSSEE